jgi:hypothetical protein
LREVRIGAGRGKADCAAFYRGGCLKPGGYKIAHRFGPVEDFIMPQ